MQRQPAAGERPEDMPHRGVGIGQLNRQCKAAQAVIRLKSVNGSSSGAHVVVGDHERGLRVIMACLTAVSRASLTSPTGEP